MRKLWLWLVTLLSGRPHEAIGGWENPYMLRWFLFPKNRWFKVFLHKFVRDDDDRAAHDHPFNFWSILIRGTYFEISQITDDHRSLYGSWRRARIIYRSATYRHRIELQRDDDGKIIPCWTLVFTGPTWREWGFWCPKGFVPLKEFADPTDESKVGKGCGE